MTTTQTQSMTHHVGFRLDDDVLQFVDEQAQQEHRTRSNLLRAWIIEKMAELKQNGHQQ